MQSWLVHPGLETSHHRGAVCDFGRWLWISMQGGRSRIAGIFSPILMTWSVVCAGVGGLALWHIPIQLGEVVAGGSQSDRILNLLRAVVPLALGTLAGYFCARVSGDKRSRPVMTGLSATVLSSGAITILTLTTRSAAVIPQTTARMAIVIAALSAVILLLASLLWSLRAFVAIALWLGRRSKDQLSSLPLPSARAAATSMGTASGLALMVAVVQAASLCC
jgi:hypothetical protein